jgi:hypothetical protein
VRRETEEDWSKREVEMTDQSDQRPWRLEDLAFEPMGDDQRERATIDGVEIVRQGKVLDQLPSGPVVEP